MLTSRRGPLSFGHVVVVGAGINVARLAQQHAAHRLHERTGRCRGPRPALPAALRPARCRRCPTHGSSGRRVGTPAGHAEAAPAAVVVPPAGPLPQTTCDRAAARPGWSRGPTRASAGRILSLDGLVQCSGPTKFGASTVRTLPMAAVLDQVAGPIVDRHRPLLGANLGHAAELPARP